MLVTAEIPDDLVPQIAEALSQANPSATAGKTPSEAVKAVILAWVQSALISYATEKARRQGDVAVQDAITARDAAAEQAQAAAQQAAVALAVDVVTDLDPAPEPTPEPPPDPDAPPPST